MPWVSGLVAKILVVQNSEEELDDEVNRVCGEYWENIHDAIDGSMHVGNYLEVPLDDIALFMERSHYFIIHPTTFELPWNLKYPREKTYPPCVACDGHGENRSEQEDNDG